MNRTVSVSIVSKDTMMTHDISQLHLEVVQDPSIVVSHVILGSCEGQNAERQEMREEAHITSEGPPRFRPNELNDNKTIVEETNVESIGDDEFEIKGEILRAHV
eukprot:26380_1